MSETTAPSPEDDAATDLAWASYKASAPLTLNQRHARTMCGAWVLLFILGAGVTVCSGAWLGTVPLIILSCLCVKEAWDAWSEFDVV